MAFSKDILVGIFLFALAGLGYIYVGYPLLVALFARHRCRQQPAETPPTESWQGRISVIVVGYNEASRLIAKLDCILASDNSSQIVEVIVASDGSDDNTVDLIGAYLDPRVQLIHFEERRGKPAVLNDVVRMAKGEVVVLTDARQHLDPQSIPRLVNRFVDPEIGVVSGELMFRAEGSDSVAARGMGAYWHYEKFLRKCESGFRGVPGATGAFYALRHHLFRPIPENTLLDDVVIPMQAIEQGGRCILEPGAYAWDRPSQSSQQESVRKRRTIAGAAQLIINQPRWLLPWRNPLWWEFVSHKLTRLLSPLLLAILLAVNVTLLPSLWFAMILAVQVGFYAAALVGWGLQSAGRRASLFGTCLMFVSLNVTTVFALLDAFRGRFRATWQRTA